MNALPAGAAAVNSPSATLRLPCSGDVTDVVIGSVNVGPATVADADNAENPDMVSGTLSVSVDTVPPLGDNTSAVPSGAGAAACGVTTSDAFEASLVPNAFVAVTENV